MDRSNAESPLDGRFTQPVGLSKSPHVRCGRAMAVLSDEGRAVGMTTTAGS